MWPFRNRREKKKGNVERIVTGLIIGGAIGSIVGKKLLDHHDDEDDDDYEEDEDDE